jgi:hypothetical protein
MATSTMPRSATASRNPALAPSATSSEDAAPKHTPPAADAEATSIDTTLDHWSNDSWREQLSLGIDAMSWLFGAAQSLRELQLATARRAEAAQLQAAEQLKTANGMADFNRLQVELARAHMQTAVDHCSHLSEAASRHAVEAMAAITDHMVRLQNLGWSTLAQWSQLRAALPQQPEIVEAELEHLTNPLAASPFAWPAQEATRQAFTLASSAWNDLLTWSGHWADGATGVRQPH